MNLTDSIFIAIVAWLFKEVYTSLNQNDRDAQIRIDKALAVYVKARHQPTEKNRQNVLLYLREDLQEKYREFLKDSNHDGITEILNREILRLREKRYDVVSGSLNVGQELKNAIKRTPLIRLLTAVLFFLLPLGALGATIVGLQSEYGTIALLQPEQLNTLVHYIFGFCANFMGNLLFIYCLKNPPPPVLKPTNRKEQMGNVKLLISIYVILAAIAYSFWHILDFTNPHYFIKAMVFLAAAIFCYMLNNRAPIIEEIKEIKNLFKIHHDTQDS